MGANSRIIPDDTISSVLITDSAHNISKLNKIVQHIDTPQAAKQAKEWLTAISKNSEKNCATHGLDGGNTIQTIQPGILIALFSLIALVIGFLARGYVISRIEGGL
jgi:hypothetical protein